MPFSHFGWLSEWWRDIWHWMSQWVMFCPILTVAAARTQKEKEEAQSSFVSRIFVAVTINLVTMVASVVVGSYITLKVVEFRLEIIEKQIPVINQWLTGSSDRINKLEGDVRVINEKHRVEELRR